MPDRHLSGARPVILFFGGMDPTGGAGLPADIKTSASIGYHGCPVVTAITVQNSGNAVSWSPVDPDTIKAQALAVMDDGPVIAVKTGMIGTPNAVSAIASLIENELEGIPFVLDPVLSSGGGGGLSGKGLPEVLRRILIPLATVCTPNLREASILTGLDISGTSDMEKAAGSILGMGCRAVLLKGGHLSGAPQDLLAEESGQTWFRGTRLPGPDVHGTGCTIGAALVSFLSAGFPMATAVQAARMVVRSSISSGRRRSHGILPGHFPGISSMTPGADGEAFYLPPRFCSRCGSVLEQEPGTGGHLHCTECSAVHYRNPLPAVTLLVHSQRRLLLVRRAVEPMKGMLSLPGGFMETGETPLECGARELGEETGLRITEARLFGIESDVTAYGGILLAAFEVTAWEGDAEAGDDASELLWLEIDQVPELAFPAHDRLVASLRSRSR